MNELGTSCGGCGFWTCECNSMLKPVINGHQWRDHKNNGFIEAVKVKKTKGKETPTPGDPDNTIGYRVRYPTICYKCDTRIETDTLAHRNPSGGWRHATCKP